MRLGAAVFWRVRGMFTRLLPYATRARAAARFSALMGVNQLNAAYRSMGILKSENQHESGEDFLVKDLLVRAFAGRGELVLFDVGANIGRYARALLEQFPDSALYAFEPNPSSYRILSSEITGKNVYLSQCALGSSKGESEGWTYAGQESSSHATLYESVLTDLHGSTETASFQVAIETADSFCEAHGIDHIDFLKIDTEGHELEVLKGASRLIREGQVDIIQFEFNEMNIVSRVFLRDFYEILTGYDIYRLDSRRLIPLPDYRSEHEIFQFQNLVAIRREMKGSARIA